MNPFLLRVFISFLVGGCLITVLSLTAERYPRIGGIIIALPSTLVVSFVFIGLTQSELAASEAAAATLANLGPATLCLAGLIRAQPGDSAVVDIVIGLTTGVLLWFIPAIVLIGLGGAGVPVACLIFIGFLIPAWLLLRGGPKKPAPPPGVYSTTHKVVRAMIGGALIASSVWVAKLAGNTVGGVIASFPIVITTTIVFIRTKMPIETIQTIGVRLPDGMALLALFALATVYSYPALGVGWGTLVPIVIVLILAAARSWLIQSAR